MIDVSGHSSIFNPERFSMPVHLFGCGGMGSHMATGLIRMGVGGTPNSPLYLHDHDDYEPHNLANQAIDTTVIGYNKAFGLNQMLNYINPELNVTASPSRGEKGTEVEGVAILCLDDMDSSYEIMKECLENNPKVRCVIETRMDAEVGLVHYFNPNNFMHQECWWQYWHPQEESENLMGCSGPQSIISAVYGTAMLALKRFEHFAKHHTTFNTPNRIYQDFTAGWMESEEWPT